jgi:hypothetical protein
VVNSNNLIEVVALFHFWRSLNLPQPFTFHRFLAAYSRQIPMQYTDKFGRLVNGDPSTSLLPKPPKGDTVPAEYLDEHGRIIPFAQRDSLRRQVADRAQAEAAFLRREQEAAMSPASRRADLFIRQAGEARARGDIKLAEMYESKLPALCAERQEEIRREQFDADPRVQSALRKRQELIDNCADYEGSWEVDRATLIATVDSRHVYDTPDAFLAAVNETTTKINRDSLIHKQQIANDTAVAAAEAEVTASRAAVAAKEAEMRLMTGGPSE